MQSSLSTSTSLAVRRGQRRSSTELSSCWGVCKARRACRRSPMLYEWTAAALPSPIRLRLRPEAATVSLGSEQVYSFDGEGRLLTAYRDGCLYKRGFDGRVLAKWRPWKIGRPEHIRRDLADDEKQCLLANVRDTIRQVQCTRPDDLPLEGRQRLEQ